MDFRARQEIAISYGLCISPGCLRAKLCQDEPREPGFAQSGRIPILLSLTFITGVTCLPRNPNMVLVVADVDVGDDT